MAQVVQKTSAAPAAEREPSDMEVLHPERFVMLGGVSVMVREYGNVEWLRLLPVAEPLVAALTGMLDGLTEPTYEMVLNAIAVNTDDLLPLILQAVGRDMDWLESLQSDEVENLLMTWWGVNFHFFVRRARSRQMVERASAAMKRRIAEQTVASAGASSTPPSSPTGTSAANSAPTPNGS